MEEKKSKVKMPPFRKLLIATLGAAAISVLYVISAILLEDAGISYRMWVQVLGITVTVVILPILALLLLRCWICDIFSASGVVKAVSGVVVIALSAGCLYFEALVLAFTVEDEKRINEDLLVVNEGFLDPYYRYYEPAAFLFRVPGELTDEMKLAYLEEKYGRDFSKEPDGTLYDTNYPEVKVSVYLLSMELADNYVESFTNKYIQDGCEELGIARELKGFNQTVSSWTYLAFTGEEDIESFAEDASKLLCYIMEETDFFEIYRGGLGYYCEADEGVRGLLTFGGEGEQRGSGEDSYKYPEQIAAVITKKCDDHREYLKELEEVRSQYQENSQETVVSDADVLSTEEAAAAVYDAVLSEEGYSYEVCYNARGNLYIDLGTRPAGDSEDLSKTGTYRFQLMYDRKSKNEKCELFVLYKHHYTEEGVNDATAILDMYAVVIENGEVIASGKHDWADVGGKDWQDVTGE